MKLKFMKALHSTALRVDEIQPELFEVEYPGLVLFVSVRHLIAFKAHNESHLIVGHTEDTKKYFHECFLIGRLPKDKTVMFYANRKALVDSLKRLMKHDNECAARGESYV